MAHPPMPSPSVSTLYADALGAFLRERGMDTERCTALPRSRCSPAQRVAAGSYVHAMLAGVRECGDAGLGLAFGSRVGARGFGLLGIAASTAPTMQETIRYLTRLESMTSTLGDVHARRDADTVTLGWRAAQPVPPVVIEGILAGWVSFGRFLLDGQAEVLGVSLAHRVAPLHAYEAAFGCPVRFCSDGGGDGYGVTLRSELLDAKPRFADPALNAALAGWLDDCAAASTGKTLTRHIVALLGARIPFSEADEGNVANVLGMNRRSLQRRLQREGTRYRQVLDAARAQHAIVTLLRDAPALADLCGEVGYDEQSSLCRAFRKWTGYAPMAFRQRLSGMFCQLRPITAEVHP